MHLRKTPRLELFWLLLLALVLLGAGLWLRQPYNVDEERFLGVALEMLQNGSWLIPHRAGEIYSDKPPLFMWTVAIFVQLTGSPRVALFLPALIAGLVSTACLYDLGRRLWNRRVGVIAALLFLATYQTSAVLRDGQIDGFLCLWIVLALYGLLRHLFLGPAWRWFYLACAAMGLGIISKGVGFLPALLLIPYVYAVRKGWSGVAVMSGQGRAWWLGLAAALAAIAVWLLPLVASVLTKPDQDSIVYLKDILLRQTAKRYVSAWAHAEPFWYFFVQVIPKYWLPGLLALPWLVPAWRRQLAKHDGRVLVLLGWVVLVLLFFSLSSGKRKLYIFPAVPGFVLAVAPMIPWLLRRWFIRRPWGRRVFWVAVIAWFVFFIGKGVFDPVSGGTNPHEGIMQKVAVMSGGADLVLVGWREGHWLFARQPIVHFGFSAEKEVDMAAAWLHTHPLDFALIPGKDVRRCFFPERTQMVGITSRDEWYLVGAEADNGRCSGAPPEQVYRFAWQPLRF